MAITTTIARHYALRLIITAVVCVVLGLWGIYDYAIGIPRQEKAAARFETLTAEIGELEAQANQRGLSATELAEYERKSRELKELGTPTAPGKYDRPIQWSFIICLPFGIHLGWAYLRTRRRTYGLDDDGTLSMPEGTWKRDEIKDMDMAQWMSKSVAYAVNTDGTRVKLDDYKHKNLHLIIGAIASRLHPDQWDGEAKAIPAAAESADAPGSEGPDPEPAAAPSPGDPGSPEAT